MRQIVTTTHTLEIAGPRGQIWRPVSDKNFAAAARLAEQQSFTGAIQLAEDAYIAAHGDMHGVAFRVRSVSETLTGIGSIESIVTEPT